ncbi:MAG: class I SAM-dependent methyltransferase [Halorhabdus sp.]
MTDGAFESYFATVYDDLYHDKDYEREVERVLSLFASHGHDPNRILDVGCGSGSHAIHLAERGLSVTGVEPSEKMATLAREKVRDRGLADNVTIEQTTIEEFSTPETFDAAVAQFNVWGYLTDNTALRRGFRAVKNSLHAECPFVFDTWYGPAVLQIEPDARFKKIELNSGVLYRYARPTMDTERNVVDVEYDVVHVEGDSVVERGSEIHSLRYFFRPEMEAFCEQTNLELQTVIPFDEANDCVGVDTWNVVWVVEA